MTDGWIRARAALSDRMLWSHARRLRLAATTHTRNEVWSAMVLAHDAEGALRRAVRSELVEAMGEVIP